MQRKLTIALLLLLLGVGSWELFLDEGKVSSGTEVRAMDDPTDTPTPRP